MTHLRRAALLPSDIGRPADGELLEAFVATRDEAAFEGLVRRHGPMVMGVCRRVTGNDHDAEDAFQASFLVLARRAAAVRPREALGNWLYGVAYRTARRANAVSARRRAREKQVTAMPQPAAEPADPTLDLELLLDLELSRLPDKYRLPLVLCHLECRPRSDVARQLRLPEGTLSSRLATGRKMLAARLARRGLAVSGAAVAALLSEDAARARVPNQLASATAPAAGLFAAGQSTAGLLPTNVVSLAEGVMKSMFLTRLNLGAVALLVSILFGLALTSPAKPRATPDKPAPEVSERAAADLRAMRGTWTRIYIEHYYKDGLPATRPQKDTFVIDGDRLALLGKDGLVSGEWTFRLDPAAKPAAIDLNSRRLGALLGIYQLDGDRLRIHFNIELDKRPAAFPKNTDESPTDWDLQRVSATPTAAAPRFANAPACHWMIDPIPPPVSMTTMGISFFYDTAPDGAALITLASAAQAPHLPELRPVLLDAAKKRYLPGRENGGVSGRRDGVTVSLMRWKMDPKVLPAAKVAHVGIEAVTAEADQFAAREAAEKAKKQGIEVLPYPQIGKAFDFELTTADGKKLRSRDLRGKVVVIDCWAVWCRPCMALMPELKELFAKSHAEGLEVIGVSLDHDTEAMTKACRKLELTWPQVFVPSDDATRELWRAASGIGAIPRVIVIDRDGILRADNPKKLADEVGRLLKAKP